MVLSVTLRHTKPSPPPLPPAGVVLRKCSLFSVVARCTYNIYIYSSTGRHGIEGGNMEKSRGRIMKWQRTPPSIALRLWGGGFNVCVCFGLNCAIVERLYVCVCVCVFKICRLWKCTHTHTHDNTFIFGIRALHWNEQRRGLCFFFREMF